MALEPGNIVYLRGDLGDRNIEEKKSVTVPAGTPGTILGEEHRDGHVYVVISLPTSPGQKMLTTYAKDFHTMWSMDPPKQMRDRFERVLDP